MEASTTTAKRKRPAPDTAGEVSGDDAVSDAEVEEFYAILRRMRDASRLLAAPRRAPPPASTWLPSFSLEDFAPAPAQPPPPPPPAAHDERVAENASPPRPGLDLNAEPEPEAALPPPAAPPSGNLTALRRVRG